MGCLSSFAKYILFFFNFIIVVCAIALIAVGAIILVNENKGIDSFTDWSIGGFAIAVGVIIFFIAFFGCCGAIKQSSCLLTTYVIILIVLLIIQIVLAALAFVSIKNDDGKLDKKVTEAVEKVFAKYYYDSDKQKIVDTFQEDFKCCGVNGPGYWTLGIPGSCYKDGSKTEPYSDGCANKFLNSITDNIKIIGGIAIAFAVVELLGAVFACMVRNKN